MACRLRTALARGILRIARRLRGRFATNRTYFAKGGPDEGVAVYMLRTRASQFALNFHAANQVQIRSSEIFPFQESIIPQIGDMVTAPNPVDGGPDVAFQVSLVEDISAGLDAVYVLSLTSPKEVTLG